MSFFNYWPTFSGACAGLQLQAPAASLQPYFIHQNRHRWLFGRDHVGAWLVSAFLKFCTCTKGTCRCFTWFENELQCKAEPELSLLLCFVVPFLY